MRRADRVLDQDMNFAKFEFFHRDIGRTLAIALPGETLAQQARTLLTLAEEMVILKVDGVKPALTKYIRSFVSFMHINDSAVSICEKEQGTISFYV